MKSLVKLCAPLLASALLASCGGGGGAGSDGGVFSPATGYLEISAVTQQLPANTAETLPVVGGPYTTEVTVYIRNQDGTLVTAVDSMNVSISPVETATFSTLDDPETQDINEIQLRLGQAPVDVEAGTGTIFITSNATPGTATVSITVDPLDDVGSNGIRFPTETIQFEIVPGSAPLPATVLMSANTTSVYLPTSGGNSSSQIRARVLDASGNEVPDPTSGDSAHNNVMFSIVGDPAQGSLSGVSASGSNTSGQEVAVRTTNGIANINFLAGSVQGPVTVRATSDGADNNVDNGIDAPVSATISLIVSDGLLHQLEITSPLFASQLPGITINSLPVAEEITGPAASGSIPPNPDATLSLTVSVLATDRQGNPVLPGTAIHFGAVDEPVWPFDEASVGTDCNGETFTRGNSFQIAGCDGNPEEGGNLFTAPTGHFTTAGGGAGPGDALVVFGEAVQGNAELESAVTVDSINSATSINVVPAFNDNDTTGSSVDYGPDLPYLVGRAAHGNISNVGTTNDLGVASAKLTYTVNSVGHAVAIWAQGDSAEESVTDALTLTYAGVAPATLTGQPNPFPGNTTTQVRACLTDAIGIPLRGFEIGYFFTLPGGGNGSVDDNGASAVFDQLTGADGCTIGEVTTSGLPPSAADGTSGTLTLTAAGASVDLGILVDVAFLHVTGQLCSADPTTGDDTTVTVTAVGPEGQPVPDVLISASCEGGLTANPTSATTGGGGTANFEITGTSGSSGTCTFSAEGVRSVDVSFSDDCFSPAGP